MTDDETNNKILTMKILTIVIVHSYMHRHRVCAAQVFIGIAILHVVPISHISDCYIYDAFTIQSILDSGI